MLSPELVTWSGLDIALIEKAYEKIALLVDREMCDRKTRNRIRLMMIDELPLYHIKCDEENNPPDVIDSGHIFVRISITNNNYLYVDVIF